MRARRCGLGLAACALLAVAGCGGGGGDDAKPKPPTAAEIEAAHDRWRDRVDAVCFEVNRAIGRRGRPLGIAAIARTVAQGVEDVRAGIRRILDVPLPKGGSSAPAAFVRELQGLDVELLTLPGGGADMEPAALVHAADRVRPRLRRLELLAGQAELTDCMTHTERELVPDGVRAPIFIARLERHDVRHVQRLPVYEEPASTPAVLADRMKAVAKVLDGAVADAGTFDPTIEAAKATGVYVASLRRLLKVVRRFEAFVRRGGATASPTGLRRHQRAVSRSWREAGRASGRCGGGPASSPPPRSAISTRS